MRRLDERDVTHLRYLSDSLAARPEKALRVLDTVREVANRPPGDPLAQVLDELHAALSNGDLTRDRVVEAAKHLLASDRPSLRRAGETLEWALEKRSRNGRRKKAPAPLRG